MQILLSNKALTWDVLRRKGREGPRRCFLCKEVEGSNFHLAVDCTYTRNVWSKIENKLQPKYKWEGYSVEICLKNG